MEYYYAVPTTTKPHTNFNVNPQQIFEKVVAFTALLGCLFGGVLMIINVLLSSETKR